MATSFIPANELDIYCRFCKKVISSVLERSIAGSGRTVNRESTYEYICTKCHRAHCFYGTDIIEAIPEDTTAENDVKEKAVAKDGEKIAKKDEGATEPVVTEQEPREYSISDHFLIGEKIKHPSYEAIGTIVGKNPGLTNQIQVKFEKVLVKLVEDVNR